MTRAPTAIVGGGLCGASLAYQLSSRGHPVIVFDDARDGRATGWTPGGINPLHGPGFPGPMAPIYAEAYRLHAEQRSQIHSLSNIDFGWKVVDRLFLAADDREAAALQDMAEQYHRLDGFSARWMDRAALVRWDSRLAPSWTGGLMTHGNARVDAERYRQALLAAACARGAHVVAGRVEAIGTCGDRISSVRIDDGEIAVGSLCLATGAWAKHAIDGWSPDVTVPVEPLIGDLLLVEAAGDGPTADIGRGLTAIYQHAPNRYWIGGTERTSGPLGDIDEAARAALLAGAATLIPGWTSFTVLAQGSAARPVTPDRLPILGRTPAYGNGWVMNGAGGKGVLLSAWLANRLVQMIESDDMIADTAPFSPTRSID